MSDQRSKHLMLDNKILMFLVHLQNDVPDKMNHFCIIVRNKASSTSLLVMTFKFLVCFHLDALKLSL